MENPQYGVINWTKVCELARKVASVIERNNRRYNLLEILMAMEMVKYSSVSDLNKREIRGF